MRFDLEQRLHVEDRDDFPVREDRRAGKEPLVRHHAAKLMKHDFLLLFDNADDEAER